MFYPENVSKNTWDISLKSQFFFHIIGETLHLNYSVLLLVQAQSLFFIAKKFCGTSNLMCSYDCDWDNFRPFSVIS